MGKTPRNELVLSGNWRLGSFFTPDGGLSHGFAADAEPSSELTVAVRPWLDAVVPGSVQQTLLDAGQLPDPYYADNLDHWRWVEQREWWYRKSFTVPDSMSGRRLRLVFDSLDTCASVFLNGVEIARHANMFRSCEIDVTGRLRSCGPNILAVCLQPPHWHSAYRPGDGTSGFPDPHRVHTRKPQFSFGWDIAPRLMTVGIPGDVRLVVVEDAGIVSACVRTLAISAGGADLELAVELANNTASGLPVHFEACAAGVVIRDDLELVPGVSSFSFKLRLDSGAGLWFPRGMGRQVMHACNIEISCRDARAGCSFEFGVRTIELVQLPQEDGGTSFVFRVNGVEMFVKGLNYTPGDALLSRIDDARTMRLVELARDCNVNMLRVWGGGYYQPDLFYDLCDRYGILVWQDFMLGCGLYPVSDAFAEEVSAEAVFQLRRLRVHPSLALMCGDNENDMFHYGAGSLAFRQCRLSRGVLRDAVTSLCPDVPYIPSSPFSPRSDNPMAQTEGDNHLWDHVAPHDAPPYTLDNSRFMSEMGRLSLPSMDVIRSFMPEGMELPLDNDIWRYHAADTERIGFGERMNILLRCLELSGHRVPGTIMELVELTQDVQAEALVYWAWKYYESPFCGGIILWNLCDCWPQMSDAIVAYPDIPKKAYYALREAYGAMEPRLANRKT